MQQAEQERARAIDELLMQQFEQAELATLVRRVTTLKQQSEVYALAVASCAAPLRVMRAILSARSGFRPWC